MIVRADLTTQRDPQVKEFISIMYFNFIFN